MIESLSLGWDLSMWRIKGAAEGKFHGHMGNEQVEYV